MAFSPECQRFFAVRHGAQLAQILINLALSGGTAGASGSSVSCCWVRQFLGEKLEPFQCWRLRGLRGGWDGCWCWRFGWYFIDDLYDNIYLQMKSIHLITLNERELWKLSISCADVPLRNCSLTHSLTVNQYRLNQSTKQSINKQ